MPTVAPLDLSGHCVAAAFLGSVPAFALAEGTVHRLDHGHKVSEANDGLLAAAPDGAGGLVCGGEDGRLTRIAADGAVSELAGFARKWITAVAAGPQGAVACAIGRNVHVRRADGSMSEFAEARSAEGLAFAPKGLRVAVARYGGVSLRFAAAAAAPVELEWKGAHTGVTFSPDGRFVVSTMQENALHGWKIDGKANDEARHMRMTGYPAKVRSMSWSAKGKWLATSGAPAAIVWPFSGRDGPMGKAPLELGTRGDSLASAVACHPAEEMVAVGFDDGMILAVRLADRKEGLLRRPGKGAITSMAWSGDGRQLVFGSQAGDCGLVDISA